MMQSQHEDRMCLEEICGELWVRGRSRHIRSALFVVFVCAAALVLPGSAFACENERFRVGPSTSLPDCRAYELVTPEELGRSQDMVFTRGTDKAIPSSDGEHLALEGATPIEPSPSVNGTRAVFSRSANGWVMKSAVALGAGDERLQIRLLSPDLSHVGLETKTVFNFEESSLSPHAFEVGPVGGPYADIANIPAEFEAGSNLLGANAGAVGVPAFSDVLFESTDHSLLPPGPERVTAEAAVAGAPDLYEWAEGKLSLVNIAGEGARCGANLGAGSAGQDENTVGAVSGDGQKVFFTSVGSGPRCEGPHGLYMRVGGKTVEVSSPAPEVKLEPSEQKPVRYNAATPEGSEVFFNTATPLTAGESPAERGENKLFMYNTITRALTVVGLDIGEESGTEGSAVVVAEDGSVVYYMIGGDIFRYEVGGGPPTFVATASTTKSTHEASYVTPNGEFLVFPAGPGGVELAGPHGLEPEPRGVGHNELYRYDAVDGSVMCVSCGEGVAPAEGEMLIPSGGSLNDSMLETEDEIPPLVQMSEDGSEVFFQTTARLTAQDTNSTKTESNNQSGDPTPGMDVYEWKNDGAWGCMQPHGCTYLISSGEAVGPSYFLGASRDGKNIFFSSASPLVPQATPEFTNIYDARVDGGFPAPSKTPECTSCQGVGSKAPLFGPGASQAFSGADNPPVLPPGPRQITCAKGKRRDHGRCVKVKHTRRVKTSSKRKAASDRRQS